MMWKCKSHVLQINWSDRLVNTVDFIEKYKCSVDGSDFRIKEPTPFSSKWYSRKFHGPVVRYKIDLSICKGCIVWVYGPFSCEISADHKHFISKTL